MDRFINVADYDVRRVTGKKPKPEADAPPPDTGKKKRGKKADQASINFSMPPAQDSSTDGEEA